MGAVLSISIARATALSIFQEGIDDLGSTPVKLAKYSAELACDLDVGQRRVRGMPQTYRRVRGDVSRYARICALRPGAKLAIQMDLEDTRTMC